MIKEVVVKELRVGNRFYFFLKIKKITIRENKCLWLITRDLPLSFPQGYLCFSR